MHFALRSHRRSAGGFTLVEILCVLAITAVLAVVSVNGMRSMMLSANLTSSASLVVNALNLARQKALSSNCPVEFRIYQVPMSTSDSTLAYRALGLYEITTNGPQLINKIIYLNGNVVLSNSTTFGTLLAYTPTSSSPLVSGLSGNSGTSYPYQYFQYRSDGSTSLNSQPASATTDTWHVMLYNLNQAPHGTTLPSNYISIELDPTSGRTETFQP